MMKKSLYAMAVKAGADGVNLAAADTKLKDRALLAMSDALLKNMAAILRANKKDLSRAGRRKTPAALIDRLTLNEKRVKAMAADLRAIASLRDPVGGMDDVTRRPNGLMIGKMRVPIGVIGIIYEARPNVTSDCIGLCLKSGNALILRGGSEAVNSNIAIYQVMKNEAVKCGIPGNAINYIESTDRKAVDILLGMTGLVDLIIPRGGESLIREVVKKARIPVIKHYKGVCHVYVDKCADFDMAERIVMNAKVQRPGVCNAVETLLVDECVAEDFLPSMIARLTSAGVAVRGCERTRRLAEGVERARESDWYEEYLDLVLSVKVVDNLEDAVRHIRKYGSMHSDAIVTDDYESGMRFVKEVDSACVYINASTRFTDGGQFGKGAEMGISTDKLHARGPMGVEELTTYKYVIFGSGQIRE